MGIRRANVNKSTGILAAAIVVLWAVTAGAVDANDVKAGVVKRAGLMKNIIVVYDVNSVIVPSQRARDMAAKMQAAKGPNVRVVAAEGATVSHCRLYYLDGKARYESKTPGASPGKPSSQILALPGGVREELAGYDNDKEFKGQITRMLFPADDAIDAALGLQYNRALADRDFKNKCSVIKVEGGRVMVSFSIADSIYEKWTLDPDKGYAPVLWEFVVNGEVEAKTIMSDMRKTGAVWIPYKVLSVTYDKEADGKAFEAVRREYTVTSVELNSPDNAPALYHIAWPAGVKPVDLTGAMDAEAARISKPRPAPVESPKPDSGK